VSETATLPPKCRGAGKPWWRGWLDAPRGLQAPARARDAVPRFSAGCRSCWCFRRSPPGWRVGIERATIGCCRWVGIIYSIKFFWRRRGPAAAALLHRLPARPAGCCSPRSVIAVGLFNMAHLNPVGHLGAMAAPRAARGVLVGHAGRRHRRVAHRSGAAADAGVMAAAYQLGVALRSWSASAGARWIAALRLDSVVHRHGRDGGRRHADDARDCRARSARRAFSLAHTSSGRRLGGAQAHWPDSLRQAGSWFVGAVVCPFVDFFTRYGTKLAPC